MGELTQWPPIVRLEEALESSGISSKSLVTLSLTLLLVRAFNLTLRVLFFKYWKGILREEPKGCFVQTMKVYFLELHTLNYLCE